MLRGATFVVCVLAVLGLSAATSTLSVRRGGVVSGVQATACDAVMDCQGCLAHVIGGTHCEYSPSRRWCREKTEKAAYKFSDAWIAPNVAAGANAAACLAGFTAAKALDRPLRLYTEIGGRPAAPGHPFKTNALTRWAQGVIAAAALPVAVVLPAAPAAFTPVPAAAISYHVLYDRNLYPVTALTLGVLLAPPGAASYFAASLHTQLNTPAKFHQFIIAAFRYAGVDIHVVSDAEAAALVAATAHLGVNHRYATYASVLPNDGLHRAFTVDNPLSAAQALIAVRSAARAAADERDTAPDLTLAVLPGNLYLSDRDEEKPTFVPADAVPAEFGDLDVCSPAELAEGNTFQFFARGAHAASLGCPHALSATAVGAWVTAGAGVGAPLVPPVLLTALDVVAFLNPTEMGVASIGGAAVRKFRERIRRQFLSAHAFSEKYQLLLFRHSGAGNDLWMRARIMSISANGEHCVIQVESDAHEIVNVAQTAAQIHAAGWLMLKQSIRPYVVGLDAVTGLAASKTQYALDIQAFDAKHPGPDFKNKAMPWPYTPIVDKSTSLFRTDLLNAPTPPPGAHGPVNRVVYQRTATNTWKAIGVATFGDMVNHKLVYLNGVEPGLAPAAVESDWAPKYNSKLAKKQYFVRELFPSVFPDRASLIFTEEGKFNANDYSKWLSVWHADLVKGLHKLHHGSMLGATSIVFAGLPAGWTDHDLWKQAAYSDAAPKPADHFGVWRMFLADGRMRILDSLHQESMAVAWVHATANAPHSTLRISANDAEQGGKHDDHLIAQFFATNVVPKLFRVVTEDCTRLDVFAAHPVLNRIIYKVTYANGAGRPHWINFVVRKLYLPGTGGPEYKHVINPEFHDQRQGVGTEMFNAGYDRLFKPELASAALHPRAKMVELFVAWFRLVMQSVFDYTAVWRFTRWNNPTFIFNNDGWTFGTAGAGGNPALADLLTHPATRPLNAAALTAFIDDMHTFIQSDAMMTAFANRYFDVTLFRFSDDGNNNLPPPPPSLSATAQVRRAKKRARQQALEA